MANAISTASVLSSTASDNAPIVSSILSPVLILTLCVAAGVATMFMLPGRREATLGKLAGVVLIAVALIFAACLPAWVGGTSGDVFYFWIFSAIALTGAVRVITHSKPVYSALYFVLTVFASAGLFILLDAEFMAAALVLIYAGAILVTYVFVIMLASQATSQGTQNNPGHMRAMAGYDSHSREPGAAAAIGFALMGVLMFVIFDRTNNIAPPAGPVAIVAAGSTDPASGGNAIKVEGATQQLGMFMFRNQVMQLELAGCILLVSMVGAIVITRRRVIMTTPAVDPGKIEVVSSPATPVDDNPHSIPVFGTEGRRQNAYTQNVPSRGGTVGLPR